MISSPNLELWSGTPLDQCEAVTGSLELPVGEERKEEGGRLLIRLRDFTKIDNCAAFDESRRAIVIAQAFSRHAQTMLPRRSQADQAV